MNSFVRLIIINRYFLYMHWKFFKIGNFCFLDDERIKLKVLACSFQNPSRNPLQIPWSGDFLHWKCLQEAACEKLILAHFPAANERPEQENIDQSQTNERVSVRIFKISNFKEINKKLIIVYGIVKDLETHQRINRKYWLKCLVLKNISISWHCPFKNWEECLTLMKSQLRKVKEGWVHKLITQGPSLFFELHRYP
jgi:hypothetical protein